MNKIKILILVIVLFVLACDEKATAVSNDSENIVYEPIEIECEDGYVCDVDSNKYKILTIGTQYWIGENLKTTKYSDGQLIPILDSTEWKEDSTGAMAWYEADETNKEIFGGLYNWYAVVNKHGLCPKDWHVPTDNDWKTLELYLKMDTMVVDSFGYRDTLARELKDSYDWYKPEDPPGGYIVWDKVYNSYDFSGLPGGQVTINGNYGFSEKYGFWWTSTETENQEDGINRSMFWDNHGVKRYVGSKNYGYSVRCVADEIAVIENE